FPFLFFFFQAEDGIRDFHVTGVQTCALPILLAMAADLRIVVLRLASRLQSLRWHAASKTPYPVEAARETMELYTPLANRLGIWQLKWEMEDLAFRFTEPETYRDIARQLESKRAEREALEIGRAHV